ncbi:hypothetical protein PF003_g12903 [Phytophthora fragariae]|nr:hypothetical protein PF003_g12903 [Phytophthora fragariae]
MGNTEPAALSELWAIRATAANATSVRLAQLASLRLFGALGDAAPGCDATMSWGWHR